jgi:glycosyltransferase involved in cell wall biosynthesis
VGADPLAVQLLFARHRIPHDGIDVLGFLPQEDLTRELLRAKALAVPSVGQESFGMVLTRGFACAVPVVASDIRGYRAVMTDETGVLVPPGDAGALAEALVEMLADEERRRRLGERARQIAVERYSWDMIAVRLEQIYEQVAA